MKSFYFITLFLFVFYSCTEKEEPLQILPPVEGGNRLIYGLAKIPAPDIPVTDQSFSGTLGDVEVSLGRIPGDTLIFIVPNVGNGPVELKVTMGRQLRTWKLDLVYFPDIEDKEAFLQAFLKNTRALQTKIQEVEVLKDFANPLGAWINFFDQKQQSLAVPDRETLAGAFQTANNRRFFSNPVESFELPCLRTPSPTLAIMVDRLTVDNSYLEGFSKLQKSALHEAVLAGLGLSFWYQKILLEYYAYQTLQCPVIQDIQLKDGSTGKMLQPTETLSFKSSEPFTLEPLGIFRRITKTDLQQGSDNPSNPSFGFKRLPLISKNFSDWIQTYTKDYQWKLPELENRSWVLAPDQAPTTTGPINAISWLPPTMDNPAVRLDNYKQTGESLTLIFENYQSQSVSFNLKLPLSALPISKEFVFPAKLEAGCPLVVSVYLSDQGTHFLEIESGTPPYQITWSTGVTGALSQTLPPGLYEVSVRDAGGCERIVEFPAPEYGTVIDIDGNSYKTVKIGTTWWMAENLRTTRKRDGTAIKLMESNADWTAANEPGFSWKNNDSKLDQTYGKLYNYQAACCDVCPAGWELPGTQEMSQLITAFGQRTGNSLKSVSGWPMGSSKANNLSGLRFLPSGSRSGTSGGFGTGEVEFAAFWTGYKDPFGFPFAGLLSGPGESLNITFLSGRDGSSVRCVKK